MKSVAISIFFSFSFTFLKAQQAPIVLQSGNTSKFFNTLDEAYTAAINGDLIYLPSGSFRMTNILNKQLNIFGVGWRTDSSAAVGGPTYIVTDFYVGKGGSNSIISGFSMPTTRVILSDSIRSFIIERSNINQVTYQDYGTYTNSLFINECLLNVLFVPNGGTTEINNTIVATYISSQGSGILKVRNSVLLSLSNDGYGTLNKLKYEIYNSIILSNPNFSLIFDSTNLGVSNTLFIGDVNRVNIPLTGVGNIRKEQTERDNIFTKYTGGSFTLEHDFRPKTACNCADRGVYSGSANFRPIPPIHIAAKSVQTSTNNNFLKFQFRVRTDN